MSPKAPGIFCLEGEWNDTNLEQRESIEPALRLLEGLGKIRVTHRDVASRDDLRFYLDRWLGDRRFRYDIGLLAFHGKSASLKLGKDNVTLDDLAEIIDGRAVDKILYFDSCSVLAGDDERLIEFCRATGAKAVLGYTRTVDWVESAAFDLLLIDELRDVSYMKPLYERLRKKYPDLTRRLGFRMATPEWVTERLSAD